MKSIDVVNHLRTYLPAKTSLFSDSINIASISAVSGLVTVNTATNHGLVTGNMVTIANVSVLTPISSLTQVNGIATAVTSVDHDLTLPHFPTVSISGANEPQYNGIHNLLSVDNRRQFTFSVDPLASSPATGTIYLLENLTYGFLGRFQITVTGPAQFTYVLPYSLTRVGTGGAVHFNIRIDAAIMLDRFYDSYTKQLPNEFWLCVTVGDVAASRDRHILHDSTSTLTVGTDYRIKTTHPLWVYIFLPTRDSTSGANERDLSEDLFRLLLSVLAGVEFKDTIDDNPYSILTFVEHGIESYNGSFYVHRFAFENTIEITYNNIMEFSIGTALRDFYLDFTPNESISTDLTAHVDLDEEPL